MPRKVYLVIRHEKSPGTGVVEPTAMCLTNKGPDFTQDLVNALDNQFDEWTGHTAAEVTREWSTDACPYEHIDRNPLGVLN